MTKKVRVRCGRCSTVNVSVIEVRRALSRAPSSAQRLALPPVGGGPVAVDGDGHERRVTHSGRERGRAARRGRPAPAARRRIRSPWRPGRGRGRRCSSTRLGTAPCAPRGRSRDSRRGVELEGGQPERGEVQRLVDLDHGSRRLVHQVDGEQQVLARRVEDTEIAPSGGRRSRRVARRGAAPARRSRIARASPPARARRGPVRTASRTTRREHDSVLGRCPPRKPAERHRAPPVTSVALVDSP